MIVHFNDCNLVLHADGTRILKYNDNSLIIVEQQGLP